MDGRREDARQDAHVGASGHDPPEVDHELRRVVDDVREVHVHAVGDAVVDRKLQGLGSGRISFLGSFGHGDTSHAIPAASRKKRATIVVDMKSAAAAALALVLSATPGAADSVVSPSEEADRLWESRAEGSNRGDASSGRIDAVLAACRRGIDASPESLAPRWRLMRALHFKGEHATKDALDKRRIFDEGRAAGEQALAIVRRAASKAAAKDLGKATPVELVPFVKDLPDAVPTFLWAGVDWGKWALAFGKMAAVKHGAAAKIRDYAQAVILLDPVYEDGGGDRVLGRLHHQTPSVPFFTGWASRAEALKSLRLAVEKSPRAVVNRLYLAEALWDYEPSRRGEAKSLLEGVIGATPLPDHLVEDRRVQEEAAALLK